MGAWWVLVVFVIGVVGASAVAWWRMAAGGGEGVLADLPVREQWPHGGTDDGTDDGESKPLVVFLTSDSGWVLMNRWLPRRLAAAGYPTVVWNSLRYYLRRRTPEQAAADLERVLSRYQERAGEGRFVLIGYSWGAGVLPFLFNRLPAERRRRLAATMFLAYPGAAGFRFYPSAWFGSLAGALPAVPEVARMPRVPSVCIAGHGDPIRACGELEPLGVTRRLLDTRHLLNPVREQVLEIVLATLAEAADTPGQEPRARGSAGDQSAQASGDQ